MKSKKSGGGQIRCGGPVWCGLRKYDFLFEIYQQMHYKKFDKIKILIGN